MTTLNTLNNTVTLTQVQLSQVIEQLEQLLFCDLVMTYNNMAENNHYERIFENDECNLNNIFLTPYDAIRQTNHDGYNENDDYFVFNGYGHACSFSYQLVQDENCPIDIEEIAQWIVDNDSYSEYDIEVTTSDDMYNAILDNLEDASSLDDIVSVAEYLGLTVEDFDSNNESPADYENSIINDIMNHIHSDFELLSNAAEFMKLDV